MYRITVKNIKTGMEGRSEGTIESCNIWKDQELANGTFGKGARSVPKKIDGFAVIEYDDADVVSEPDYISKYQVPMQYLQGGTLESSYAAVNEMTDTAPYNADEIAFIRSLFVNGIANRPTLT